MQFSEQREELFKGMFTLKSKLKQPKFDAVVDYKDKGGRSIKFEYASLGAIEEAIRLAAQESKSGIDFQQEATMDKGLVYVTTLITHQSGQFVTHGPLIFSGGSKPQDLGSVITYAKRYGLAAAFGIAADKDTDGPGQTEEKETQSNYIDQDKVQYLTDFVNKVANIAQSSPSGVVAELKKNLNTAVSFEKFDLNIFKEAVRLLDKWFKQYEAEAKKNNSGMPSFNQEPQEPQRTADWGNL